MIEPIHFSALNYSEARTLAADLKDAADACDANRDFEKTFVARHWAVEEIEIRCTRKEVIVRDLPILPVEARGIAGALIGALASRAA